MKKHDLSVKGLSCANCAAEIERALAKCKDFESSGVNFVTSKIKVSSNLPDAEVLKLVKKIVAATEPSARVSPVNPASLQELSAGNAQIKINLILFVLGLVLALIALLVPFEGKALISHGHGEIDLSNIPIIALMLSIVAGAVLCATTFTKAVTILIRSHRIDENLLICISVFGALAIGSIMEGLLVIVLYQIGKFLESMAVGRSRKSVAALTKLKAPYANVLHGKQFVRVDISEINVGDIIEVRAGEVIAVDGIVTHGESNLNKASLTGESVPEYATVGAHVLSGVSVIDGVLEIKATAVYEDSTAAKILELLETAQDKKSRAETVVTRAAKYYTPIVLALAVCVLLALPLGFGFTWREGLYRALTFLVVACPCAIAISVPLNYFAGLGYAGSRGVLIKGSSYLDNFLNIKHLVLDKTGTLTTGNFSIKSIEILDTKPGAEEVLKVLASGETKSNHPLAKAVCAAYKGALYGVSNYKELSGRGISFIIGKDEYYAGKAREKDIDSDITSINLYKNNRKVAVVYLEDEIKHGARETVMFFKFRGVKVHMLTGDGEMAARRVAERVGIDNENLHFGMLPVDKYNFVETLIKSQNGHGVVSFAGDGINDTPVITLSDIGITMGALGSQSSIEAGDMVIMDDNLGKMAETYALSRRTRRILLQNLIFAFGTKLLFLALITFGLAGMLGAVVADVGVTLVAILNSLRQLLPLKKPMNKLVRYR